MPPADLPAAVTAFLLAHIDSIPQLEALVLLYEHPEVAWTRARIEARLYLDAPQVTAVLRHLTQRRLVMARTEPEPSYAFDSRGDRENLMASVVATYRSHLIAVTRFIHAKAPASLLDFARAFDFKGDR